MKHGPVYFHPAQAKLGRGTQHFVEFTFCFFLETSGYKLVAAFAVCSPAAAVLTLESVPWYVRK
jgi:hypothetical protein